MNVIDNFLSPEVFNQLYRSMLSVDFKWETSKIVDDTPENHNRNMQMVHMFYERHAPVDESIQLMYPILQKIQPCAIIKIKANLVMGNDTLIEHGLHIDVTEADDRPYLQTSILYMNSCDGYTMFEDGTKVESVANRFVTFPNAMRHTGTNTTDSSFRMVINFNYV
ncbi:hypothetical protein [Synechococcus phage S-H25]|nr:hypothetical protein [Synechococcus phage S-H25]